MSAVCPCCKREWPAGRSPDDARRLLGDILARPTRHARVLAALVDHFGEYVPRRDLIDHVFGNDPDGGPLAADDVVRKLVRDLRRRLAVRGFELIGLPRHGTRLAWREPGEAAA